MNSSLIDFCNLIADEGSKCARQHKELFLNIVKKTTNKPIPEEQIDDIYKIFSFLNWVYATGIWSNLKNTTLRRDLMEQSMRSIMLRTTYELAKDKSKEGIAFFVSRLEQEFREFVLAYNRRIKQLLADGSEPDADTASLCALEWIQNHHGFNDDDMKLIAPQFSNRVGYVSRIEDIAKQVNHATKQRKN